MNYELRDTRTFEGFKKFIDDCAFELPWWYDVPEDDEESFISDLKLENQIKLYNEGKEDKREVMNYFYGDDGERYEDPLLIGDITVVEFVIDEYKNYYIKAIGTEECREYLEEVLKEANNKVDQIKNLLKEVN